MQTRPHRRSFATTTIVASCASFVLFTLLGATFLLPRWNTGHQLLPAWGMWLLVVVVAVGLLLLGTSAILVAIGGVLVLHRDSCEERGLPYISVRPRERIAGPMVLAIRRFLAPRGKLLPGELVEVRSLPEILATLDERGCLEGLPFMPEMVAYCGHRFPVQRRVDKVWEYAHGTGMRRMRNAVLLKTLRCGGQGHGGCQAACQLIWKESWLKPAGTQKPYNPGVTSPLDLDAYTRVTGPNGLRYVCQMTEIRQASTQMELRHMGHYWRDLISGNIRLFPFLIEFSIRMFNGVQWRFGRSIWPILRPMDTDTSPHKDLGLQAGRTVRVKSKHAIESTLNRKFRNRGLEFSKDMLFYCGGSYRVAARIDRVLHEATGEMLLLKTPSILLEDVHGMGGPILNPQNEFFFWREIWLEPQPSDGP